MAITTKDIINLFPRFLFLLSSVLLLRAGRYGWDRGRRRGVGRRARSCTLERTERKAGHRLNPCGRSPCISPGRSVAGLHWEGEKKFLFSELVFSSLYSSQPILILTDRIGHWTLPRRQSYLRPKNKILADIWS